MTLAISPMLFLWQLSQLMQLCFISAAPNTAVGEALPWPLELSTRWCQFSSHGLGCQPFAWTWTFPEVKVSPEAVPPHLSPIGVLEFAVTLSTD